jgi:hypothetical protein
MGTLRRPAMDSWRYKRQTIKAALDALQPPAEINLEAATKVLLDFGHAWENEPDRHKRNELLRQIFDRV